MRQEKKIDRRTFMAGAACVSAAAAGIAGTSVAGPGVADESIRIAQAPPPAASPPDRAAPPPMPTRSGFYTPTRFEGDVYDCEVIGKIPSDLNGAFVRVGGEWVYPPKF